MNATIGTRCLGRGNTVLRRLYGLLVAAALAQNATQVIRYVTRIMEEVRGLRRNAIQMQFTLQNVMSS